MSHVSEQSEARGGPPPASAEPHEPRFGPLLKSHRVRRGLTQRDLAGRSGLSLAAIRDLEQGRSRQPRRGSVRSLAVALGLSSQDEARFLAAAFGGDVSAPPTPITRVDADPVDTEVVTTLGVLGPVALWHGGIPVPLTSPNQMCLLLRLALSAGDAVGREELMDLIWGERRPASAANLLHTYVGRLRRLLRPESGPILRAVAGGYRLEMDAGRLDLSRFRELASLASKENDPERALDLYAEAVRLWRGETDVDALRNGPLMAAVTEEYVGVLCAYASVARDLGESEQVLPRLRELAARLELHEPLHAALVMSLSASGRQADALAAFERVRAALADQLGIDPGERLREAHEGALRQRWNAAANASQRRAVIRQAPSAPPDFVGRSGELARIVSILRSEVGARSRVIAVNGAAGVGKTALALEASGRLRDAFPDGELYADLRGASSVPMSPLEVLGRFLRALGVPGERIGADESEAAALLRSELAERRMLLVLDNAKDGRQVSPLLPGTGACGVLVTSRRRLTDLVGATVIDLPTLPVADALALLAAAAGAQRIAADPQSARQLTAACGQLPLALRIAGARLSARSAWSAADLAERLRDESRRLAELSTGELSVLASFQLSYQDLSDGARRTFRLCALHPGDDFALDATAVLLDTDAAESDRILGELLEANMLLQYSADRFRFHDLLGLYAARLLSEHDPGEYAADRDRYYDWYLRVTTAAMEWVYPQLVRWSTCDDREAVFDTPEAALEWLHTEVPALVALIERLADSKRHRHLAWQLADQLRGYFFVHRQVDRWLRSAEAGMRAAVAEEDPSAQAAMHMSRGQAMWGLGRHEEALAVYTEGARHADAGGWRQAAAYLRHNIGWVLAEQGRLVEAERSFHLALELSDDELGHVRGVTLNGLGYVCSDQGRLAEAAEHFGAALRINQKTGREKSLLANRSNLGMVLRQLGHESAAEEHLRAALDGHRRTSNLNGELATLEELSLLHTQRGQSGAAVSVAEQGYDLAVTARDRRAQAALLTALGEAHLGADDHIAALESFARALEIADEFPFLATRATIGTANVLVARGDIAAARLHAERALAEARGRGYGVLEADALAAQARCVASEDPAAAARFAAAAAELYRAAGVAFMAARVEAKHSRQRR